MHKGAEGSQNLDATTDLSNTFLRCNLCFFSSTFVEGVDGLAEDKDATALGMVLVVLACLAGRREDNSSSSCARKKWAFEVHKLVGVNNALE